MTHIRGRLYVNVIVYRCYIRLHGVHCAKVKGVTQ